MQGKLVGLGYVKAYTAKNGDIFWKKSNSYPIVVTSKKPERSADYCEVFVCGRLDILAPEMSELPTNQPEGLELPSFFSNDSRIVWFTDDRKNIVVLRYGSEVTGLRLTKPPR